MSPNPAFMTRTAKVTYLNTTIPVDAHLSSRGPTGTFRGGIVSIHLSRPISKVALDEYVMVNWDPGTVARATQVIEITPDLIKTSDGFVWDRSGREMKADTSFVRMDRFSLGTYPTWTARC
jgi:hypothetical protein